MPPILTRHAREMNFTASYDEGLPIEQEVRFANRKRVLWRLRLHNRKQAQETKNYDS
jgi:hypothetical protein